MQSKATAITGTSVLSTAVPLLEQFAQSPLLIDPDQIELIRSYIRHVAAHPHAAEMFMANDGSDFWPTDPNDWRAGLRPYNVQNGVLQIPVAGVLLNKFGYQFGRYATGYTYIERALQRGLADPAVRGIAFIHDSPGGEVAGNFELNDKIHAARGEKPMRAFAADHSYSASYSLASAADDITVSRSGGVGSIGVVTAHVEYSEMLKAEGIKVTFIYAGKHKVEGNSYEKLSDAAKTRVQDRIDKIYGVFSAAVARNRDMEDKAIRATEALTYDADDAIKVGLADKLGSLEDELAAFSDELEQGDRNMPENATANGIPQIQHDQAVTIARSEGMTAGMKAQKDRINAILSSEVGKARPEMAFAAALKTEMTVEEATEFLSAIPVVEPKPTAKRNHFEEAMGTGDPKVTAGDGDDDAPDPAKTILGHYKAIGGRVRSN